jgi:hypothetical protein
MKKKFLLLAVVPLLVVFCSKSFAGYNYCHNYYGGMRDNYGWNNFDFGINFNYGYPPAGAVFSNQPFSYPGIYPVGIPGYYYGNNYLTPYTLFPASQTVQETVPAAAAPTMTEAENMAKNGSFIVISIPKKDGGFVPVRLMKHGNGYIGPQGEFYAGHPTVDQLSALYGE